MKIPPKPNFINKTGFIICIYQLCYFGSKARTVRVRARHTKIKFLFLISISQQSRNRKHLYLEHVYIGGSSAIQ